MVVTLLSDYVVEYFNVLIVYLVNYSSGSYFNKQYLIFEKGPRHRSKDRKTKDWRRRGEKIQVSGGTSGGLGDGLRNMNSIQ